MRNFVYQTENYMTTLLSYWAAAIQSILDFVLRGFENPFSFIPPFQTVVCVKWQMVVLCARYKKFFVMENLCKQFIVLYWQSFLILTLLLWLLILLALFCCCHLNRNWLPKWSLAVFLDHGIIWAFIWFWFKWQKRLNKGRPVKIKKLIVSELVVWYDD